MFVILSVVVPLTTIAGLNFILEQYGSPEIPYNFWSWLGVWLVLLVAKSGLSVK
jgi:hypothetical protein